MANSMSSSKSDFSEMDNAGFSKGLQAAAGELDLSKFCPPAFA
jgi:hypothetical protein